MKSFKIGKVIYNILTSDTGVTSFVNDKVFPLVVQNGTDFPFVVYSRVSTLVDNSKDRFICSELCDVQIMAVSADYEESVNIADVIHQALYGKRGNFGGIDIVDIQFDSIQETFQDDAYAQIINYKILLK